MDSRLRILERQAEVDGTTEAWQSYAKALQRTLKDGPPEKASIWVSNCYYLEGSRAGSSELAFFSTEKEAYGHSLDILLDEIGEIAWDADIDPVWYAEYQRLLQLVKDGHYLKAWKTYSSLSIEGSNLSVTVDQCEISQCTPAVNSIEKYTP